MDAADLNDPVQERSLDDREAMALVDSGSPLPHHPCACDERGRGCRGP